MKKLLKKLLLIILGACDNVMSMFIPLAVALLWIIATEMNGWKAIIMLGVAIAATLFRGVKVWLE